ncbi:hypothetical protein NPIL_241341 [Nephila pilipes]|uniref:Uncharacterized protein n=1 Tax=Nephila pilipes TaxID=299642 RepID=A0A8X6TRP0_NEPPI|nr:hypothetical protein NPIL_241341 [Nephila pilipes]
MKDLNDLKTIKTYFYVTLMMLRTKVLMKAKQMKTTFQIDKQIRSQNECSKKFNDDSSTKDNDDSSTKDNDDSSTDDYITHLKKNRNFIESWKLKKNPFKKTKRVPRNICIRVSAVIR